MNSRHIFHLSIPVSDLETAKRFYVDVLNAKIGRENDEWLDVLVWGHQITLQKEPKEVLPLSKQGKRHFGVTLPWDEWERTVERIRTLGLEFMSKPVVLLQGSPQEQGKFYLTDPGNNVIELKTYRDIDGTLGFEKKS